MGKKTDFPDKKQLDVINDQSNTLKVVAGPGAGKTSTLVEKLIRLIDISKKDRVDPKRVLFITFTRNSAKDIRKKLLKELEKEKPRITIDDLNDLYVSTFHGFCNILREEYKEHFLDYKDAVILDEEQSFIKISDSLFRIKSDNEEHDDDEEIDSELNEIWKGEPEEEWLESEDEDEEDEPDFQHDLYPDETLQALQIMQENYRDIFTCDREFNDKEVQLIGYYLGHYGAMRADGEELDFGMLIRIVVETLRKDKEFRKKIQEKYDFIFVDEFQDTNKIQEELLGLISGSAKIIVVGDDWQSIYGFRGSNKEIFNNFAADNELVLPINYRSKTNVVTFANSISNQENAMDSYTKEGGNKVIIKEFKDSQEENKEILAFIENLPENLQYSDIAILTTSLRSYGKNQNPIVTLIELLKSKNIPLKVSGEGNLINHDYISDIISLFEYISDKTGIIEKPELEILSLKFIPEIYKENQQEQKKSILELLYVILKDSEFFIDAVKNHKISILKNIGTLTKVIDDYEEYSEISSLNNFIKYFRFRVKYFDEADDSDDNAINVMTLHKAKGLEFKVVIIPYITHTRYPGAKRNRFENFIPELDPKAENLRSFYVGVTRAKELLHLSYHNTPSSYIKPLLNTNKFTNFIQCKGNQTLSSFCGQDEQEEIKIPDSKESDEDSDMNVLSFGKIVELMNCPLKYHIKFDYGLKLPISRYYGFGLYMHNLLKDYNWSRKLREEIKQEDLIIEEDIPKPGTKKGVENQFGKYVSNYDSELNNIIALEKSFKIVFPRMQIVGRADLIIKRNSDIVIIDFKSGEKDKEKIKLAKTQLCLYALCMPELNINKAEIYFLKDGKSETFDISDKDKEDMKSLLLDIEKYLESKKISCNNNPKERTYHCLKCELAKNDICPFSKIEKKFLSRKDKEIVTDDDLNILLEFEPSYNL
jgi:DNA helicase-2/ATP-dependent DNA helicase PcrA